MTDHQEDDLAMALRLSMEQHESPEPKRSKPGENCIGEDASPMEVAPEETNRRMVREMMAAAAEKRLSMSASLAVLPLKSVENVKDLQIKSLESEGKGKGVDLVIGKNTSGLLSVVDANQLFAMIFGNSLSKDVLAQWSNQGIRFSDDLETSMGLVQHEGGPCGVLAAIQAFVLKHLLFSPETSGDVVLNISSSLNIRKVPNNEYVAAEIFSSLSEEKKLRALVRSMSEILFLCGNNERAVIASLNILEGELLETKNGAEDDIIARALEGLSVESGADLQKVLRYTTWTSQSSALQKLEAMLPVFRSRMGALLFLISALLSRGVNNVQDDRDDPSQPLVTAPFGHASQEIVNLLLSGNAAANVFDGKIDLGGGMFVKGISRAVEIGFLTLMESLNFCKVGQYLKCPKWPIWVVGSESHYTVLFALETKVQEENEFENRESQIRRAFDGQDQSGGGGFISVQGFHQVVKETNIMIPPEKVEHLCSTGFIVWSEFWQALLDLDKSLGGVKDSSGSMGKKVFDLYHFNGIAKSITTNGNNQSQSSSSLLSGGGSENLIQRPRLTKLRVSVPPRWTPEEFMADVPVEGTGTGTGTEIPTQVSKPQHAPLVDCIRTRWARAVCNWEGDAPSIV